MNRPALLAKLPDLHQQLHEILQRPLYQRWRLRQEQSNSYAFPEALRTQLEHLRDALKRFFEWLFRHHSHSSWTPPSLGAGMKTFFWVIAWTAVGLFVLALVMLIVRLIRNAGVQTTAGPILSREQVDLALTQGDALALAGDEWLDQAGRLAAEKNFRAMYRALYLGLLSGLHSRGKIDFNRHYTNWTYVRHYRGDTAHRDLFSSLTDLFDSVWYGLKEPPHADLATLTLQVRQLIQQPTAAGEQRAG